MSSPADEQMLRPEGAALAVWRAARTADGDPPPSLRVARVRDKLADPTSRLLVVERDGHVVGMALAEQYRHDGGGGEPVSGWGHVSMVFVDPASQGQGVGRELMRLLVDEGPWSVLSLWTRRTNTRAHALYRGQGFRPTGELGETPAGAMTERWQRWQR